MRSARSKDAPLLSALGHAELHACAAQLGERGADRLGLRQRPTDQHERRHERRLAVVLHEEGLRHLVGGLVGIAGEVEGLTVGEPPVAHLKHLHTLASSPWVATATASSVSSLSLTIR